MGALILDAAEPPPVKVATKNQNQVIIADFAHRLAANFKRDFFGVIGEANSYGALADKVLLILAQEGDPDGLGGTNPTVDAEEFARVMRGLAKRKVAIDEPQLRRRVNEVLTTSKNVGSGEDVADLGIDLPDLEDIFDQNIAEEKSARWARCRFGYVEELKVFQVVDRLASSSKQGMLPIGPGNAGGCSTAYWRETPTG